jgi:hypothetical protein
VAVGQARHRPSPGKSAGTRTVPTLYLLPVKRYQFETRS